MTSVSTLTEAVPQLPTSAASDATDLPRAERLFRFALLTLTLVAPALLCLMIAFVADPDIWWHLSSGDWILQHHVFPRTDVFSYTTLGRPWQAYSWLFEVLVAKLYSSFGLSGIAAYSTAMVLAITAASYRLVSRLQQSVRVAIIFTALASFAILTLYSPRPWHFTVLFFVIELDILLAARRSGNNRELFLLPVLFALWSNLHIQFIDGLLLLVLVFFESLAAGQATKSGPEQTRVSANAAALLLGACFLATLLNPYGWHIYQAAHDLASQTGVLNGIEELRAMPFRSTSNFIVLFLTLVAGAMLARDRRFSFFETSLLIAAIFLSFRSQRDIWIVVTVSVAIIASRIKLEHTTEYFTSRQLNLTLASAAAACVLLCAGALMHVSNSTLQGRLERTMPVRATEFVRSKGLGGPVFCDFIWGGYLIHSLGMPVSIDGRAALHGDKQLDRSARTWAGATDWSSNPQLLSAGVVVAPASAALTQLLRLDGRFDRMYEDKVAVVFVPHASSTRSATPLH